MKFLTLLLCAASAIALVNAKHNAENRTTMMAVKPTSAPLTSSTVAPTKGPPKLVSPTKPMIAKRSQPLTTITITKKPTTSASISEKQMKLEALPLAMPATVETPQKPAELQPLAVTGFITRNGSIYEITDKNGIGQIQARQANDDDTNAEHVCNYGPVVIYSDVPCDRVTNVKVKEYETKPNVEETSNAPAAQEIKPTESKPTENGNENNDNKESEDKEDLTDMKKPVRRRRPNKKRANKNKNTQKQKQQKNKKRNSNQNNQVRYGGNNNNKNNNRRRLQQQEQQQEQKRRNQQKRRRQQAQQQDNRRKWQYEDEVEEDDYDEPLKPIRRKPNKNQRRQQVERYTSDYEDY